ncbi:sulfatase-like hydrolase/transferase [Candidatus Saccharibacteria bacterium]|nr:sulfatase-like hydrolase/transferase [Candidatus Saccharibacteria bacterium]
MKNQPDKPVKNKNKQLTLKKTFRRIVKRASDSSLPEILFISTFILVRWWNNSDFSYPSEIIFPVVIFSILATAIFYIYRRVLGVGLGAHIAALGLIYLLYVFKFIEGTRLGKLVYSSIPDSLSTVFSRSLFLSIVLGLLCGLVGWYFGRVNNRSAILKQLQLYKVLLFSIVFIFLVQAVRTGGRLIELRHQLDYKYPATTDQALPKINTSTNPDIYYLVFDRYAGATTLKNNFNYDNSEFMAFLQSQGFVNREDALSNYPFTMSSVASTMAMNYFPEFEKMFGGNERWQSGFPYRSVLNDPPIAQTLRSHGYSYEQVSSWWDFTRVNIKADDNPTQSFRFRILNKDFYLSDLQRDIIYKSVLSPWSKKGITLGNTAVIKYDLDRHPRENFENQLQALKSISNRSNKAKPTFTFAHVLAPHPPYVFDALGNQPKYDSESNDNGADESLKYTNELTYVNKRLKELVNHIKLSSPSSVIILQADEGPYPKQFRGALSADSYYDPSKLPQPQLQQKFSILASYSLPGVAISEVNKIDSSVNVFRVILNNYFGYKLPLLPACNLSMGNKFNVYNYSLINDRLTGKIAPDSCAEYD